MEAVIPLGGDWQDGISAPSGEAPRFLVGRCD